MEHRLSTQKFETSPLYGPTAASPDAFDRRFLSVLALLPNRPGATIVSPSPSASAAMMSHSPASPRRGSYAETDGGGDKDYELDVSLPPVTISISARIHISSANNVLHAPAPPHDYASVIAARVVEALEKKQVPFADEEGRLRPIRVEIDASTTIEGPGNIVGNEDVVLEALKARACCEVERSTAEEENSGLDKEDRRTGRKRTRGQSLDRSLMECRPIDDLSQR